MMKKSLMILAALGCLCCTGQAARARFIKVYFPDGSAVTAELAVTDEERQQGLMFRDKIEESQGMLFVFEGEDIHAFWMKNMKFPIDILWLDSQRKIVHIEANVPPCTADPCPSYIPKSPARYVLELKSGAAARHGLHLYDRLEFVLPRDLLVRAGGPAAQRD
jgi:uncharacterized membrane protein (UPF0127 family)